MLTRHVLFHCFMSPTTDYYTDNLNSSILVGGWMSGFRSMYSLTPSTLCRSTQVRVHTSP